MTPTRTPAADRRYGPSSWPRRAGGAATAVALLATLVTGCGFGSNDKPATPAASATPSPSPTATSVSSPQSYAGLILPGAWEPIANPYTATAKEAKVSASTWRSEDDTAMVLADLERLNGDWTWRRSSPGRLQAVRTSSKALRHLTIDAVTVTEAKETLVRILDTRMSARPAPEPPEPR